MSKHTVMAIVMVMGLAASCSGGGSPAASSTSLSSTATLKTPAGYRAIVDTADRFHIAVPSSWRQVILSAPGGEQALQALLSANVDLKSAYGDDAATFVASGTKFWAFDVSAAEIYIPNFSIIVKTERGVTNTDLPDIVSGFQSEYRKVGATVISSATVTFAGHPTYRVMLQVPIATPSDIAERVDESLDILVANGRIYALTFSGTSADFSAIASTFSVS